MIDNELRLFIAVDIESNACIDALHALQHILPHKGLSWVSDNQFHLTLKFLGNTKSELVENIVKILKTITFRSFKIQFNETGAFPNKKRPRVLWTGINDGATSLIELSKQIDSQLATIGIPLNERPFQPHLTLARVKTYFNELNDLLNPFFNYKFMNTDFSSIVTKVVLKKSNLKPTGAVYEDLYILESEE